MASVLMSAKRQSSLPKRPWPRPEFPHHRLSRLRLVPAILPKPGRIFNQMAKRRLVRLTLFSLVLLVFLKFGMKMEPKFRRIYGFATDISFMPVCGRSRPIQMRQCHLPTHALAKSILSLSANPPRDYFIQPRCMAAAKSLIMRFVMKPFGSQERQVKNCMISPFALPQNAKTKAIRDSSPASTKQMYLPQWRFSGRFLMKSVPIILISAEPIIMLMLRRLI